MDFKVATHPARAPNWRCSRQKKQKPIVSSFSRYEEIRVTAWNCLVVLFKVNKVSYIRKRGNLIFKHINDMTYMFYKLSPLTFWEERGLGNIRCATLSLVWVWERSGSRPWRQIVSLFLSRTKPISWYYVWSLYISIVAEMMAVVHHSSNDSILNPNDVLPILNQNVLS